MDYPIHIDAISMELSILYFKGLPAEISIKWYVNVPEYFVNIIVIIIKFSFKCIWC